MSSMKGNYQHSGSCAQKHPIAGIQCGVKNCVYHSKGTECCAERIEIRPLNTNSSNETACATYRCEC